jgi:hypothetical protein
MTETEKSKSKNAIYGLNYRQRQSEMKHQMFKDIEFLMNLFNKVAISGDIEVLLLDSTIADIKFIQERMKIWKKKLI